MDVAAACAEFDIIIQVEIDGFCQKILKKHAAKYWPNAVIAPDVRQFGRDDINGATNIDLLFGGFPCQPFSVAGKQLADNDERNLWSETRRIISELRPRAILLENVKGLARRYKDADGQARPAYLGVVIAELSAMGYVGAWGVLSASSAGAPHQRDRVFIVAYDDRQRQDASEKMGNATSTRLQVGREYGLTSDEAQKGSGMVTQSKRAMSGITQSRLVRDADGLPDWLDRPRWPAGQGDYQHDPEPPRTLSRGMPNRTNRIKALGNAVVPQVVYPIFKHIKNVLSE